MPVIIGKRGSGKTEMAKHWCKQFNMVYVLTQRESIKSQWSTIPDVVFLTQWNTVLNEQTCLVIEDDVWFYMDVEEKRRLTKLGETSSNIMLLAQVKKQLLL